MYNAYQTCLLYPKLANSLYLGVKTKKDYAGFRQMKDKTRVPTMSCTDSDGARLPIASIGKPKKPVYFGLLDDDAKLQLT